MLLRLPLAECSAKVRTGFPLDEEEDYDLEIWAGIIPMSTLIEAPVQDPALRVATEMPPYVERYRRPVPVPERPDMCGVIGLLLRDPRLEPELGALLVPMIEALDERGPDSSGIALYAERPTGFEPDATTPTLRVSLGADVPVDWIALGCALLDVCSTGADVRRFGAGAVIDVPEASLEPLKAALAQQWPDVRILGTGWNLRVLKDTGRPTDTCARTAFGNGRDTSPSPTPAWPPSRPSLFCIRTPSCPTATSASCTTGPSRTTPPCVGGSRTRASSSTRTTTRK